MKKLYLIIMLLPLGYFGIGAYRLILTSKKVGSQILKKKIYLTFIGSILIPIGLLFFMFRSLLWWPTLWNTLLGQIFLGTSPIFILWSRRASYRIQHAERHYLVQLQRAVENGHLHLPSFQKALPGAHRQYLRVHSQPHSSSR